MKEEDTVSDAKACILAIEDHASSCRDLASRLETLADTKEARVAGVLRYQASSILHQTKFLEEEVKTMLESALESKSNREERQMSIGTKNTLYTEVSNRLYPEDDHEVLEAMFIPEMFENFCPELLHGQGAPVAAEGVFSGARRVTANSISVKPPVTISQSSQEETAIEGLDNKKKAALKKRMTARMSHRLEAARLDSSKVMREYSIDEPENSDRDDDTESIMASKPILHNWKSWNFLPSRAILPEELILWDTFLAVAMFTYVCFYRPYKVTYAYGPREWFDWMFEIIFYSDIAICSQTAYLSGGYRVVVDSKLVFRHYLRGWFVCDLVASIPWDIVVKASFNSKNHPKEPILQLLSLFSVLRVLRAPRIVHRLSADWTMHTVKRAFLVYAAFTCLVANIMACLFYLCPVVFNTTKLRDCTTDGRSKCSWRVEHGLETMPRSQRYLHSLYWSFTTMTTLGYGDIVPRLGAEMVMGIFAEVIGAGAFALLVMHIQKLYDVIVQDEGLDVQQRNELTIYLEQMSVHPGLKKKIMRYLSYEANLHRYSSFNDDDPRFSRLNHALKTELRVEIFSPILKRNEVFNKIPAQLTRAIAEHIQSKPCSPGEWFIEPGTYGDCAFILLAGRASVADMKGTAHSTLRWSDANNVVAISSLLDDEIRDSLNSITKDLYAEAIDHCSFAYIHREVFRQKVLPACPSGDKLLLEILAKQAGVEGKEQQSQSVWVGGIPEKYCYEEWINRQFNKFGHIAFITCRVKPTASVHRSWALVSFWNMDSARTAAGPGCLKVATNDGIIVLRVHLDQNATKTRALALFQMRRQTKSPNEKKRRSFTDSASNNLRTLDSVLNYAAQSSRNIYGNVQSRRPSLQPPPLPVNTFQSVFTRFSSTIASGFRKRCVSVEATDDDLSTTSERSSDFLFSTPSQDAKYHQERLDSFCDDDNDQKNTAPKSNSNVNDREHTRSLHKVVPAADDGEPESSSTPTNIAS